jgi:hypothetical protein
MPTNHMTIADRYELAGEVALRMVRNEASGAKGSETR